LDKAHKSFNKVHEYDANIARIRKYGINVVGAFIVGFETDTLETFQKTYDFAMRNRLAMVNMGIMTPFPGTEIYAKAKREGLIRDDNWEHYTGANLVWEHPGLDKAELERAYLQFRRKFYGWRSIAKRFWDLGRQLKSFPMALTSVIGNAGILRVNPGVWCLPGS